MPWELSEKEDLQPWGLEFHNKMSKSILQSKKEGKDQERYNQVPHLTQDTNGKVTKLFIRHHKREPRGKPFPSR